MRARAMRSLSRRWRIISCTATPMCRCCSPRTRPTARGYSGQLRESATAASDDRRAPENRRPMRWRALRHGHARPARCVRTHLGHPGRLFWPKATQSRAAQTSGLPFHGRGLLGHGMDAAAAGLRLHLRQAVVRPAARASRSPRARALSARIWTFRTSSPAFWRTTTSRGRPRRFRPMHSRGRRRDLPFFSPGLRFFHQGQFEGRRTRISPHLVRGPNESG